MQEEEEDFNTLDELNKNVIRIEEESSLNHQQKPLDSSFPKPRHTKTKPPIVDDNLEDVSNNGSGQQQNKTCFGVFASFSHGFVLKRDKEAEEVAVAMQSAFRVLSLAKPDTKVLVDLLLKSSGFSYHASLSEKVDECLLKVQEQISHEYLAITLRDFKRFAKAAESILKCHEIEE